MPFPLSLSLAIALALAPALIASRTGRSVLARIDDPALPELLLERARRIGIIALTGAVLLALLFSDDLLWALPLLWLALLVSGYPLRRRLFAESWSIFSYLRYTIASAIGTAGLWLLAALAPAVTVSLAFGLAPNGGPTAERIALWYGGALAVVVALWWHHYSRVWLDLHHATPLRDSVRPELMARLEALLERVESTVSKRPALYRFGPAGGHLINALAIPSRTAPAVVFSDGLLSALTDDEIVAVFAHELAHHEQFAKRYRRRWWPAWALFAAAIVLLPVALIMLGPTPLALFASAVLPFALIIALGMRRFGLGGRPSQQAETASDLRAAELTGDANAVASALLKIHAYNRVPRRWAHAMEQVATHPSVARRIQALRNKDGTPVTVPSAAAAPAMTIIRSPATDSIVALDPVRSYWFEGVAADIPLELDALRSNASSYRAVAYGDLAELRIATSGDQRTLNATDLQGQSWSVSIAPSDVAAVQTALDLVDVKLGRRPVAQRPAATAATRWLAIMLLVMLAATGEIGIVLVPILFLLFRPALTPAVAAAGAIGLDRAIVALRNIGWADSTARRLGMVGAIVIAAALLTIALQRVRDDARRRTPTRKVMRESWLLVLLLGGIGVLFCLSLAPLALERTSALLSNSLTISLTTTLVGVGAAFATMPGRRRRWAGGLTSGAAFAGGLLLSGEGWLFHRAHAVRWSRATITPAGAIAIPDGAATLVVSPDGGSFAVTQYRTGKRGGPPLNRYLIGQFSDSGRTARPSAATSIHFLDDEYLLALETLDTDSLELRMERVAPDSVGQAMVLWRVELPPIDVPLLTVDRARHAWIVAGRGDGDESLVVVTDSLAGRGSPPRRYRWSLPHFGDVRQSMSQVLTGVADGSVVWSTIYASSSDRGSSLAPILQMMAQSPSWEVRKTDAAGDRFVGYINGVPFCSADVGAQGALCIERSFHGETHFWRLGTQSTIEPAGDLPPLFDVVHAQGIGRIVAAEGFGSQMAVADLTSHQGWRLTLPDPDNQGTRWRSDVAAAGEYVFVLSSDRNAAMIRRYLLKTR